MEGKWENKIAVVTGASGGIGASIAKKLANSGMLVIGLARRSELIDELNKDLIGTGKIISKKCNVTNSEEIDTIFQWIRNEYKTINVFVNNAGMMKSAFLIDSQNDDIKNLFDLNVISSCICVREAMKIMRDNSTKGHIIILNSVLGNRIPDLPVPSFSVYPSTKYALTALCQTVRQEIRFNKLNIKLTSINPGMVDTDLLNIYKNSPFFENLPKLNVNDVAEAVIYALNTPDYVQIDNICLQAVSVHK